MGAGGGGACDGGQPVVAGAQRDPAAEGHIAAGLLFFQQHWAAHLFVTGGIGFDHSLFELVKIPVAIASAFRHPPEAVPGVTLVSDCSGMRSTRSRRRC